MNTDIIVVGSGMGGSASSIILSKLGYKVLLIEKGMHPKFSLGESTTPLFSKKLHHLGKKFGIPEFINISSYEGLCETENNITCGPKELFHYLVHKPGQTTANVGGRYQEVIVQTPEVDTQFLRADIDQRLVEIACSYGVTYFDHTTVKNVEFNTNGIVANLSPDDGKSFEVNAKFLIDATGFRSFLSEKLNLRIPENELDTPLRSRCIFTHFENVGILEDAIEFDSKFKSRCKIDRLRATQHHCFDGGWIWFIPFGNGVTSVGINLDIDKYPINELDAEEEFWLIIKRYPIIKNMLAGKNNVNIPFIKTGRIQFCNKQMVGDRWAQLPASAFGLDGWFSTGLAITLVAIDRLVSKLDSMLKKDNFTRSQLVPYEVSLTKEWWNISRMVNGMYKSFKHFDVFKSYCFLCFMGAESYVQDKGFMRAEDEKSLLLNVGNEIFINHFETIYAKVLKLNDLDSVSMEDSEYLRDYVQNTMSDFNFRDYGNKKYDGIHYKVVSDKHINNTNNIDTEEMSEDIAI